MIGSLYGHNSYGKTKSMMELGKKKSNERRMSCRAEKKRKKHLLGPPYGDELLYKTRIRLCFLPGYFILATGDRVNTSANANEPLTPSALAVVVATLQPRSCPSRVICGEPWLQPQYNIYQFILAQTVSVVQTRTHLDTQFLLVIATLLAHVLNLPLTRWKARSWKQKIPRTSYRITVLGKCKKFQGVSEQRPGSCEKQRNHIRRVFRSLFILLPSRFLTSCRMLREPTGTR